MGGKQGGGEGEEELQREGVGRLTFMPLNRLQQAAEPEYPNSDEAIPMMARLTFEPTFRPAMMEIFRKGLIVRTLDIGARFARCTQTSGRTLLEARR